MALVPDNFCNPSESALALLDATIGYGPSASEVILRQLNFQIGKGECFAIIGPSGSGKTSLLKALAGLIIPQAGQLLIGGQDFHRI